MKRQTLQACVLPSQEECDARRTAPGRWHVVCLCGSFVLLGPVAERSSHIGEDPRGCVVPAFGQAAQLLDQRAQPRVTRCEGVVNIHCRIMEG
ncbi:hypothetical protein GCM10020256_17860 [Streptomyces thermocoprophilus]